MLTIFAPGGRPLSEYVSKDAVIKSFKAAEGKPLVSMVVSRPGREERWEFSPEHDWIPVLHRITLQGKGRSDVSETRVTEFGRENGRWFPMAGTRKYDYKPGETHYTSFRVSDLRVNREIPASVFEAPQNLETGVIVKDRTKDSRSVVVGAPRGREALKTRTEFLVRHGQGVPAAPSQSPAEPIRASPDPESFPWLWAVLVPALVLVGLGLSLKFRRSPVGE